MQTHARSAVTVMGSDVESTIWGEDAQERWQGYAAYEVLPFANGVMAVGPDAADEVMHNSAVFSSNPDAVFLGSPEGLIPIQIDPPHHTDYRRILDPLFSPKRMKALEDDVEALTNKCIDTFVGTGQVDFAPQFAVPLPSGTFLRLLGLDIARLDEFLKIAGDILRPEGDTLDEVNARRLQGGAAAAQLFESELDQRMVSQQDDILGHFAALEKTKELTRGESLRICHLLLFAGLDTVTDSLECFMAFLGRSSQHRQQLVADPSLIPAAVEELLRWTSVAPTVMRITMVDTVLGETAIPKGTRVGVLLAPVHFDEARIANPGVVDFERSKNPHVAFGTGVHRCLGSHLARMELKVALSVWHKRIPEYSVPDDYTPNFTSMLRSLPDLRLEFPITPQSA